MVPKLALSVQQSYEHPPSSLCGVEAGIPLRLSRAVLANTGEWRTFQDFGHCAVHRYRPPQPWLGEWLEQAGPLRHARSAVSSTHGGEDAPRGPAGPILSQPGLPGQGAGWPGQHRDAEPEGAMIYLP